MESIHTKMSGLKVSSAKTKAAFQKQPVSQKQPVQYFLNRINPETGKLTCDTVTWTPIANKPPLTVTRLSPPEEFLPRTIAPRIFEECSNIAEEVWYLVQEWYRVRGIPVPPSEEKECLEAIAAAANPPSHTEPSPHSETVAASPPTKPAYGTPEFWKAWWAKKRAKEAAATTTNPPTGGAGPAPQPVKKTTKKKEVAV